MEREITDMIKVYFPHLSMMLKSQCYKLRV